MAPLTGQTNDKGVASFPLMNRDKLVRLTAWTNDFKIGGYYFNRKPTRNPAGSQFTIELEKCRSQLIRLINGETKAPIPNIDFVLTVGTGPPDYQYPGNMPDCDMRTNAKGEAVYRWFPDWKSHYSYIEIRDPWWVNAADEKTGDGAIVFGSRKAGSTPGSELWGGSQKMGQIWLDSPSRCTRFKAKPNIIPTRSVPLPMRTARSPQTIFPARLIASPSMTPDTSATLSI